jgi:flagellar L-ring protein precursor FlgH
MRDNLSLIWLAILVLLLSGCDLNRLRHLNDPPPLTQIENPTADPKYHPVTTPLPHAIPMHKSSNSLWQPGARSFFKDQRANQPGDILTVLVDISDQGQMENKTDASRTSELKSGITAAAGFEVEGKRRLLPSTAQLSNLVDLKSSPNHTANGKIDRKETIKIKLAAMVIQVLPNGNLVIRGRQELRVNYEVRDVQITGIVRPQDITSENTVDYDKIAEARIAYDGRGDLSYVQTPPLGQKILDTIIPF